MVSHSAHTETDAHGHDVGHDDSHAEEAHGSLKSYVIGFVLSAILTIIPFWLVMASPLANANVTAAIVVLCAIVQIMVHTVFFLHVTGKVEGGWTLLAYLFTLIVVIIMIAGSLWIMYHLNSNMMPGMMSGSTSAVP